MSDNVAVGPHIYIYLYTGHSNAVECSVREIWTTVKEAVSETSAIWQMHLMNGRREREREGRRVR